MVGEDIEKIMVEINKQAGKGSDDLLSTPSLAAERAFVLANPLEVPTEDGGKKKIEVAYGEISRYLRGKFEDLQAREGLVGRREELEAERSAIVIDKNNRPVVTQFGKEETATSVAARLRIQEIDVELKDLKEPIPMPSSEKMIALQELASQVDLELLYLKLQTYNIKHWGDLNNEQREFLLPVLEKVSRDEYYAKLEVVPVANYRPKAGEPAPMTFEGEDGITYSLVVQEAAYEPLDLEQVERCEHFAQKAVKLGREHINEYITANQNKFDIMMGEYPHFEVDAEEVKSELIGALVKRGTIDLVTGVAGGYLAGKVVKAGAGMISADVATKAGAFGKGFGVVGGMAGGIAVEAPIDMGLTALFLDNSSGSKLGDYQLKASQPKEGEIEEMLKKEIFTEQSFASAFSGFIGFFGWDKAFMAAPDIHLGGKAIPSLSVSVEDFEAGVKGKNEDVAKRLDMVKYLAKYCESCDDDIQGMKKRFEELESKELEKSEKVAQPIAATDPNLNGNGTNEIANNSNLGR